MLNQFLGLTLLIVFMFIALFHLVWTIRGPNPNSKTLPQINGQPAFIPSRLAALAVTIAFTVGMALIAMRIQLIQNPSSENTLRWMLIAMSLIFLARAIGDFNLVGFFKRKSPSHFARLDNLYFSPLCLGVSLSIMMIAF